MDTGLRDYYFGSAPYADAHRYAYMYMRRNGVYENPADIEKTLIWDHILFEFPFDDLNVTLGYRKLKMALRLVAR